MGEPILLVAGKNNEKFLGFAPHGAGRNLSRTALKAKIGDEEAQSKAIAEHTKHIDVRWYSGKADLSETPVAYKNAAAVRAQIEQFELADVLGEIHPLGCIMAGEGDEPAWKKARAEKLEAKND
jgi:RNA-splicing ligase RtcB